MLPSLARVRSALIIAPIALFFAFAPAAVSYAAPPPPASAQVATAEDPLLPPADDGSTIPGSDLVPPAPAAAAEQAPLAPVGRTALPTSVLGWVGLVLLVLVSLALTLVAFTTLAWMLHAWRTPEHLEATRFRRGGKSDAPLPRFTLLVPARHEEAVLGQTLDRLAASEYDDLEVIAIIGHDDDGTEQVARAAAARHPDRVRVVIDHNVPKNKPKALNTALAEATGEVVGVFDAEDEVHVGLLPHIAARFAETGADVVQGGVQLMNLQTSWWSLRNVLEYYFWFRSRLHFHAGARFIPLGGNTVFVRTDLLREIGGWDAECLAEDCELGVRLSTRGAVVAVAYDPELVTREETPGDLTALIKQRTRWAQGFLQVLRKGIWRQLPTRRQRLLAWYTLAMPFLQAFTGLMIPISLAVMLFAKVPTGVALISFLPLVPTLVTLAVEAAGLGEFSRAYGVKVRARDYLRLLLGTFPYQMMLAAASVRAVLREARGDGSWEKTAHTGAHREEQPSALQSAA